MIQLCWGMQLVGDEYSAKNMYVLLHASEIGNFDTLLHGKEPPTEVPPGFRKKGWNCFQEFPSVAKILNTWGCFVF